MKNYFITATDTDAGKTFVASALICALVKENKRIAAYKPVAAGCQEQNGVLVNEDAALLAFFSNCSQDIPSVNPIALIEAIAPHIAAAHAEYEISLGEINKGFEEVLSLHADINVTEGAGGWRLPLSFNDATYNNQPTYLSDFAKASKQDVILIVNMKLGCLNHALLTYQAIIADGLNCIAWVANSANVEPMSNLKENIASLEKLLPMPKIAQFEYFQDTAMSLHEKISVAAKMIDITPFK